MAGDMVKFLFLEVKTMDKQIDIIITGDGSHSLMEKGLNEPYHSLKGALSESLHVFIEKGLKACQKQEIRLLEIGFGTGLNALLTFLETEKKEFEVWYDSIEKHPLPVEMAKELNYPRQIGVSPEIFKKFHEAPWNERVALNPRFYLKKIKADLLSWETRAKYDLVYFDAFCPDRQPEMWEKPIFLKIYEHMVAGGILVTYSAKGKIKRLLKEVGFLVEALPGPPGKREMTRAVKKSQ